LPFLRDKKVEPPTNIEWDKFYDRIFLAGDWEVTATIGLTTDDHNKCEYTIYLVDGDRWIEVEHNRGVRGCGAPQSVYRFFMMFPDKFTNHLTRVPGKDAKFVAVGLGNPKIVEQNIRYFNRKTGKAVDEDGN
jgi:hypothetical protein